MELQRLGPLPGSDHYGITFKIGGLQFPTPPRKGMNPNEPALLEDIYSRIQIGEFLEKTSPQELLTLEKIDLTCNPIDPNMGGKILFVGKTLPNSWDPEWEPCRNDLVLKKFVQNMKIERARVQEHYARNIENYRDISTLEGQKRLAEETGALGSSFILHYYNPRKEFIGQQLAKGWLALAKALNDGNFGVDTVISLSFARFVDQDETSRLKIQANCPASVEIMREVEKVLQKQGLKFSIKIKTDVASYVSSWAKENGYGWIRFESPLKGKVARIDELADRLKEMNVTRD